MDTFSQTMLLTDGMSTKRKLTKSMAETLKRESHVIVIGTLALFYCLAVHVS